MSALDDRARDTSSDPGDDEQSRARLADLEEQVVALRAEVASLRDAVRPAAPSGWSPGERRSFSDRMHAGAAISGDEIESVVGRYGMPALAGLLILMAVGALIKVAVDKGLLTPEVRIAAGALAAVLVAIAGLWFRRRGDVRYGSVLLALSLAIVDLVAWGAGPRLHLVPTPLALGVVDLAALALAALAVHDASEFLFAVAVAGALSAPFVTSDVEGTALSLVLYGGVVLAGALRSVRDAAWTRAFAVLLAGALVYSLAAGALPISTSWYGPYLVVMFGGACAAAALLVGERDWRGELPRAYLALSVVGVFIGWDAIGTRPFALTMTIAVALAGITHAALLVRGVPTRQWAPSALVLPFVSLGVAYAGVHGGRTGALVLALWTLFALGAWRLEHANGDARRGGTHLLAASVLGFLAVTAWLWDIPFAFVAGLSAWAVVVAALVRSERHPVALAGVALTLGSAALSAIDQLASRYAYSYTPFATRSSASAMSAALGLWLAGEVIGAGKGPASSLADRPVRLGALIGLLIIWGRMEMAQAFSPDLAGFLLVSYYAACGVASIVAGRRLGIGRLRVAGLALAIYAGLKGLVEVTEIGSVLLRVGAYAAVGLFLLGAGYLYREQRPAVELGGERMAE